MRREAPTTEISCTVRQVREKAIAVADGTMQEVADRETGEVKEREKWFWLPLSAIEVDPSDYEVGDTVTVTLPERLATEKEII
jgi:hypothetical protein